MGSGAAHPETSACQLVAPGADLASIMAMQSADDGTFDIVPQSRAAIAVGSAIQTRCEVGNAARGPYWPVRCHSQCPDGLNGAAAFAGAVDTRSVAADRAARNSAFIRISDLIRGVRRVRASVRAALGQAGDNSHALRAKSDQAVWWLWFGKNVQAREPLRRSCDRCDADDRDGLYAHSFISVGKWNGTAHSSDAFECEAFAAFALLLLHHRHRAARHHHRAVRRSLGDPDARGERHFLTEQADHGPQEE